eukprot:419148_1
MSGQDERMNSLSSQVENMDITPSITNDNDEEEKELECHARMISFFAHKGGVSKTTNVHHLAYILAKKFNFKVLMVDGDPQQNLTQTCCKQAKNDSTWRDQVDRGTIFTAVERLHYGMKDGDYIDPANCIQLHESEITNGGELWLLAGSLDLAKLEAQITFAHNVTNPSVFPLFDDIAGGFRHLIISTCAQYNIDFCLIDMGPSIGELNKSLFWASDYFIIPCSADSYCKTTIKTMQSTLPQWNQQQKQLISITNDMTMPINNDIPKFLGVIFSLFQTSGKNKTPVKHSKHWMNVIKQCVVEDLIPAIKNDGMVHEYCNSDYTLAEIPNFLSLQPIAQRTHYPVYDIQDDGYYVENENGDHISMSKTEIQRHKERAKYFERVYEKFAQKIIDMINAEETQEQDID